MSTDPTPAEHLSAALRALRARLAAEPGDVRALVALSHVAGALAALDAAALWNPNQPDPHVGPAAQSEAAADLIDPNQPSPHAAANAWDPTQPDPHSK